MSSLASYIRMLKFFIACPGYRAYNMLISGYDGCPPCAEFAVDFGRPSDTMDPQCMTCPLNVAILDEQKTNCIGTPNQALHDEDTYNINQGKILLGFVRYLALVEEQHKPRGPIDVR